MIGPIGAISEPSQTPWCRSHSLPSGGILLFCAPAAAHANFLSLLGRGAWDCEASIDAVGWTSRDGRHRKFCGGNWLCGWVVGLAQSNEGTRHWKSAERRRAMCVCTWARLRRKKTTPAAAHSRRIATKPRLSGIKRPRAPSKLGCKNEDTLNFGALGPVRDIIRKAGF